MVFHTYATRMKLNHPCRRVDGRSSPCPQSTSGLRLSHGEIVVLFQLKMAVWHQRKPLYSEVQRLTRLIQVRDAGTKKQEEHRSVAL